MQLSCADAGSGNAPIGDRDLALGGITLEGLAGDVEGSRPSDVGLSVPSRHAVYFVKAPAWLKAGAARTTVALPASSGGYLAWVPASVWIGGGGVDLSRWMASRLVFDGCPDRDSTYFGGLLSTDPHICLTLQVADAAGRSRQVRVGSAAHC